jgi:hypothetical protein
MKVVRKTKNGRKKTKNDEEIMKKRKEKGYILKESNEQIEQLSGHQSLEKKISKFEKW